MCAKFLAFMGENKNGMAVEQEKKNSKIILKDKFPLIGQIFFFQINYCKRSQLYYMPSIHFYSTCSYFQTNVICFHYFDTEHFFVFFLHLANIWSPAQFYSFLSLCLNCVKRYFSHFSKICCHIHCILFQCSEIILALPHANMLPYFVHAALFE